MHLCLPAAMYPDNPEKVTSIHQSVECLQAEDISEAVVYVLSCPPHTQVIEQDFTLLLH